MGGKGDDNSSQNDSLLAMQQRQEAAQKDAAAQSAAKQAAEAPVETPKKEEEKPVTEQPVPDQQPPAGDNLTGLGDELVNGLSLGRTQQVADQQARLKANPQTYGTGFDPYTGTFRGQGNYDKTGQV